MTLAILSTVSPTLTTGAFNTIFGDYEKVMNAIVMINEGFGASGDGLIFQTSITITGATVATTILKANLEEAVDADRDWEVAVDANLTSKTVTIIADCI